MGRRVRGVLLVAALLLCGPPLLAQARPRLVVVLSVDQMRADYLDRFGGLFEKGLARIAERGVSFTEAHHAHAFTETAPGHATLVTGVHPSRSGIVSNEWWDRTQRRQVYAVEDVESPIVGVPDTEDASAFEGRSPVNLLRNTLGDWLKDASPESKVYAIAIKDRVAVLMGGKHPDGAFWYHRDLGRYVTSAYYRSDLPDWVTEFNQTIFSAEYLGRTWERFLPDSAYGISRADSFPAEDEGVRTTFPHVVDLADTTVSPFEEFIHTPFGDVMNLALARKLVENERLGDDDIPDALFVGMSAADLIGHRYGPFSQEVEDYYVRLDRMLGEFLDFLDDEVGRDRYAVVLTADHGVAALPEFRAVEGKAGVRVSTGDFREALLGGLTAAVNELQIYAQPSPRILYPLGLVLNFRGEEVSEETLAEVGAIVAARLREVDVIADAFPRATLMVSDHRPQYDAFRRSFYPERSADVILRFQEFDVYPPSPPAGHGSMYAYDTHVPLIFVAPGRSPRAIERHVWTVSLAPTVAALLGIAPPDDLDGRALTEVAAAGPPAR